jgi:protein-tyrosine-phosphatase
VAALDLRPSEFLQLIGDPLRWSLLEHLRHSDRRVGDLVGLTGRPQNVVSYHLGELRSAGLVTGRRSSADGRDTYYRLHPDRFAALLSDTAAALDPTLEVSITPAGPVEHRRSRPRVLFLCTGNSARSQIAEALTVHRSEGTIDARSAGSHPKVLHPNAVRVLAERGIDISGATTKHLDTMRRVRFDRVVTLCDKVKEICPEFPGAPSPTHWSTADPATTAETDDATYPAFVAATDDIDLRVGHLLAEIRATQEARHAHR